MARLKRRESYLATSADRAEIMTGWPYVSARLAAIHLDSLPDGPIRERERALWQSWRDAGSPPPCEWEHRKTT